MTDTDYVSYPIALALKKHGFDELCDKWIASKSFSYYDEDECCDHNAVIRKGWLISQKQKERYDQEALPYLTLWQAQKWLREKGVAVSVQASEIQGELWYSADIISTEGLSELVDGGFDYMAYESALSAGIAAALELIEKKGE
jgi:hypothetical protein